MHGNITYKYTHMYLIYLINKRYLHYYKYIDTLIIDGITGSIDPINKYLKYIQINEYLSYYS